MKTKKFCIFMIWLRTEKKLTDNQIGSMLVTEAKEYLDEFMRGEEND